MAHRFSPRIAALATLLAAGAGGSALAQQAAVPLQANRPIALECSGSARTTVPIPDWPVIAGMWYDAWFSDAGGATWYTPEDYAFAWGDTAAFVQFIHLEGSPHRLLRVDAFYLCGTTDPLGYVHTSGLVDYGLVPENQPDYGWIIGTFYPIPPLRPLQFDGASRVKWIWQHELGVPLTGRPDCFTVN